jgi:hypothetical protein
MKERNEGKERRKRRNGRAGKEGDENAEKGKGRNLLRGQRRGWAMWLLEPGSGPEGQKWSEEERNKARK